MAEVGCLKDGNFQNLEANNIEAKVFTGGQAAFVNKYGGGLPGTLKTITHAHTVAGEALADFTHTTTNHVMTANAVNETTFSGNAAGLIALPSATQGTCCLLRSTAAIDEGQTLTIQTWIATDRFAYQTVGIPNGATVSSVVTTGSDAVPAATEIKWTGAATNPQMGLGSEFWFFCPSDGVWVVDTRAVVMGTGAVGVMGVA